MKAPSLLQLITLAKSKTCTLSKHSPKSLMLYRIMDNTDISDDKTLLVILSNSTFKDHELRRGIKGFLDAL